MRLDLNLLTALRILLEERNVTHAAKRLFVSQPALSKTLQRLRLELNDPLFTRAAHGLVPTPRALELEQELPQLLDQLSALVTPTDFIPAEFKGKMRIAGSELLFHALLPSLVEALCRTAPQLSIQASEVEGEYLDQLANGRLDFALHINTQLPSDFITTPLVTNRSVCVMSNQHPLATLENRQELSIEEYLDYPHVRLYMAQITRSDIGVVDELLAQAGMQRHIILETSNVVPALKAVAQTNALMVLPETLSPLVDPTIRQSLTSRPLPTQLGFPALETVLIQHRRSLTNPAHQWFREKVQTAYIT